MGRFTAWMASRRQAKRTARVDGRDRRHARPLSFERCEQRIALSTTAAGEGVYVEPSLRYYITHPTQVSFDEGGAVTVDTHRALGNWHLTNKAGSFFLFMGDADATAIVPQTYADLSSSLDSTSFNGAPTRFIVSGSGLVPAAAGDLGVFISDSQIVPIPPPSHEPHGGNEGGHIAMTPFIAPSMLGLPGGGQSQLAAETRQSLTAEQLGPAPVAGSAQQDSLQGRAVIYEVAQVRPLNVEAASVASRQSKLNDAADHAATRSAFEFVMNDSQHRVETQSQAVVFTASRGAAETQATRATLTVDRADAALAHHDVPFLHETLAAKASPRAHQLSEESTIAAAHDAALKEFADEFQPIGDEREVAAATVDLHGKRVLGGALIAVAAVPVVKVIRRQAHRSTESRPPREAI
ncbi:MAG TPA: hypothetical protein VF175_09740 [Lacipirellula sp.]